MTFTRLTLGEPRLRGVPRGGPVAEPCVEDLLYGSNILNDGGIENQDGGPGGTDIPVAVSSGGSDLVGFEWPDTSTATMQQLVNLYTQDHLWELSTTDPRSGSTHAECAWVADAGNLTKEVWRVWFNNPGGPSASGMFLQPVNPATNVADGSIDVPADGSVTAAGLKALLEAKSWINDVTVTGAGSAASPWEITFNDPWNLSNTGSGGFNHTVIISGQYGTTGFPDAESLKVSDGSISGSTEDPSYLYVSQLERCDPTGNGWLDYYTARVDPGDFVEATLYVRTTSTSTFWYPSELYQWIFYFDDEDNYIDELYDTIVLSTSYQALTSTGVAPAGAAYIGWEIGVEDNTLNYNSTTGGTNYLYIDDLSLEIQP